MRSCAHAGDLLEGMRRYFQGKEDQQREIFRRVWSRAKLNNDYHNNTNDNVNINIGKTTNNITNNDEATNVDDTDKGLSHLLRVYLSLSVCPVLDTVLCDKRSLSAYLFGVSLEESGELIHPRTHSLVAPPFISQPQTSGFTRVPSFPLQSMYFLKDPSLNRGKGVKVLPKNYHNEREVMSKLRQGFLLQEAVEHPLLLKGFKFTFRLYLFVNAVSGSHIQSIKDDDNWQQKYDLYLSRNGNVGASHFPYISTRDTEAHQECPNPLKVEEDDKNRAQRVTNLPAQPQVQFVHENGFHCPAHPTLPLQHRLWEFTEALIGTDYEDLDLSSLRDTIKRMILSAVLPAFKTFTKKDSDVISILPDSSSTSRFNNIHSICQTLYGIDLILHREANGSIGVKLLEVQKEPNTELMCSFEATLYSDLARGVQQIIHGEEVDDRIFEKIA